jgi:hypothetical protein
MSVPATGARPLHLQTIESLFAELIGGTAISVGAEGAEFRLDSEDSRAILNWYRLNRPKWAGNVMSADVEAIVNAMSIALPNLPIPDISVPSAQRRLRLTKVVAHRFAGIHSYGTAETPPADFVFEPHAPITLLEGWNGSGKTSLINLIVWCLTGQILRPQRPPESAQDEFEGNFTRDAGSGEETTSHALSPITPLPNPAYYYPPANKPVPIDSWVELTFVDQDGKVLLPIRRTQLRKSNGKLSETEPNFSVLGVDPIAMRIGTTMPALLPFLRVGETSDLGLAVAKLTGLADLSNLSKHATVARTKLLGELKKTREREIEEADARFLEARGDLQKQIDQYPHMVPSAPLPTPSASKELESGLADLEQHFSNLKAEALKAAQTILGSGFDPTDKAARDDLEQNIGPAQGQLKALSQLTSARRLKTLLEISDEDWQAIDALTRQLRSEAAVLAELAAVPALGRRKQLYARVASWMADFEGHDFSACAICSRSLTGVLDPVTQRTVADHLAEISAAEQELLSLTQAAWATKWTGVLVSKCPAALRSELSRDLPDHPSDLMRATLVDEMFGTPSFSTILVPLKNGVASLCDQELKKLPPVQEPAIEALPEALAAVTQPLLTSLRRFARAREFAAWHNTYSAEVSSITTAILQGTGGTTGHISDLSPIGAKLEALASIVKGVAPLNTALELCQRIVAQLNIRRAKEDRIAIYARAAAALAPVVSLGSLAEKQVEDLRKLLHTRASYWRDRCYANAYVTAGHALRDTAMDVKGVLEIQVGSEKANAPAQHISNASALRASLMGFFLAFWEHVLINRGGIALLILDDPQELLDYDNRERLAGMLPELVSTGGQLLVATCDRFFARAAVAAARKYAAVEHRSVHPVNAARSVLETALAVEDVELKREAFERDKDDAAAAQDYASEVRVFVEARLGDLFDDPVYPAYSTGSKAPALAAHLNRLRGLTKSLPNALFKSNAVLDFCNSKALADGADCLKVLNTSHHNKASLSGGDVNRVASDLDLVRKLAEKVHSEFRHWRWREPLHSAEPSSNVVPFRRLAPPAFRACVHPDLAAFTATSGHDATQDVATEVLTGEWFADKTLFYIRTDNLGFAVPSGCIAIVESSPYLGKDHNLVIARQKNNILARRLLRSLMGDDLILAAEATDPRHAKPTLTFSASDITVYRIVGMLMEQPPPPFGKGEATEIDAVDSLTRIRTAYRVREDSGVPLALPGQVVLGGEDVTSTQFDTLENELVALTLRDGTSVFKRVGKRLPGALGRFRQFESIGGLGASQVVAMEEPEESEESEEQSDIPTFAFARRVLGVLYTA